MVVGTVENLSWDVTPIPNSDRVTLSWVPVDGSAAVAIASNIASATGVFAYTVPGSLSGKQLKLRLVGSPSGVTVLSPHIITITGSNPAKPTYRFTSPVASTTWNKGTTQVISWDVQPFPSSETVQIFMVRSSGGSSINLGSFPANALSVSVAIDSRFTSGVAYFPRLVSPTSTINSPVLLTIAGGTPPPPPPPSSGLPAGGCVYGTFDGTRCVCIGESSVPSGSPGYCRDATGACTIVRAWTGSAFAAC
jgi:hypothetical protein